MSKAPQSVDLPLPTGPVKSVAGRWLRPDAARWLYVMAHGAGAPMTHPFMEAAAQALAERGIATLRFNFPYADAGRKRPDREATLKAVIGAAVEYAARAESELPLIAGGKSLGGRMTAHWVAQQQPERVRGLIFLGFPLHRPGAPSRARAELLSDVRPPMLFLQGDRDKLASPELIRQVCDDLGERATLRFIRDGDHSFAVRKRSGRTAEEVLDELADATLAWLRERV